MHEMGLAEGVLAVALDVAGPSSVQAIRVRIGDRQAVVPDSFEFCFRLVAEGTAAADARLELEAIAISLSCATCGSARDGATAAGPCPACGGTRVEATGGDELTVSAVQLGDGEWVYAPPADLVAMEAALHAVGAAGEH